MSGDCHSLFELFFTDFLWSIREQLLKTLQTLNIIFSGNSKQPKRNDKTIQIIGKYHLTLNPIQTLNMMLIQHMRLNMMVNTYSPLLIYSDRCNTNFVIYLKYDIRKISASCKRHALQNIYLPWLVSNQVAFWSAFSLWFVK